MIASNVPYLYYFEKAREEILTLVHLNYIGLIKPIVSML